MAWRAAKSLLVLLDQVNQSWPARSKASDGLIGDASHQAVPSDHNPNAAGVVTALDLTHDPAQGFDAHVLADRLLAIRHPDLKYVISNGRIAGAWTNWQWWRYSGTSDPHIKHIHVSVGVGDDGKSKPPYDDTTPWNVIGGTNMITISEDEYNDLKSWKSAATAPGIHLVTDPEYQDLLQWKRKGVALEQAGTDNKVTKAAVLDYVSRNLQ